MTTVAYCHPLVPPEWIATHGLQPQWMQPRQSTYCMTATTMRGVCPYAGAVIDAARSGLDASGLVLTTVCDQMRYGAAALNRNGRLPVFLFNVPSTWQTSTARALYLDELHRLGKFLVQLGGVSPCDGELGRCMHAFDAARSSLLIARDQLSARQFAEELVHLRSGRLNGSPLSTQNLIESQVSDVVRATIGSPASTGKMPSPPNHSILRSNQHVSAIPLAIVGGPLVEKDFELFDFLECQGGRVVLDATEGGIRMLPSPFDGERVADDPLAELARAYFDSAPDVFRRPNDALYHWLDHQIQNRGVRGILFRRYVWCDLWHAELSRFRDWSPVPVLEIDVNHDDHDVPARVAGRVEAFLEMLR